MIWLTWRQLRTQALVLFGVVAAFAVLLAVTGPGLAARYRTEGAGFLSNIGGTSTSLYLAGALLVLAVPFIVGMFWGAPLITRELETGTCRLAWTQTTRARWLAVKLAIVGLAAMAAGGALSLLVTWWAEPIDSAIARLDGRPGSGLLIFPRLSPEMFDERGIAPLGYAAFGFALGVTIGTIVRRTLPAMALTLAVLALVQVGFALVVRPDLISPEHLMVTVTRANFLNIDMFNAMTVTFSLPGAWSISQQTISPAGHPVTPPAWLINCPPRDLTGCLARFTGLGYRQLVSYQPASRFWTIQCGETAIYLLLAVALAGLGGWWLCRRLALPMPGRAVPGPGTARPGRIEPHDHD
jgi:hypothetical protein